MKLVLNKSSLIFNTAAREVIIDLDVIIRAANTAYFNPATRTGEAKNSGAYHGYIVDLSGLYEQGFRKVVFKANEVASSAANTICLGAVCTGQLPTTHTPEDTVESYTDGTSTEIGTFELPITPNSSYLHATYCYNNTYAAGCTVWTPENGDAKASSYEVE